MLFSLVWTEHFPVFDFKNLVSLLNAAADQVHRERERERERESAGGRLWRQLIQINSRLRQMPWAWIYGKISDKWKHSPKKRWPWTSYLLTEQPESKRCTVGNLNTPTTRRQSHGQQMPTPTPMHLCVPVGLLTLASDGQQKLVLIV